MGHLRVEPLPCTRQWNDIIGMLGIGAGVSQLATATLTAAERGMRAAPDDAGVVESLWLLVRLPVAARNEDFTVALRRCGLDVPDRPGLMNLVGAASEAIDAKLSHNRGRTDLGELAQISAAETLVHVVGGRTRNLFDTAPEDVRAALAGLATPKQFGVFARDFFGRFVRKSLAYFLSKALPTQTGEGECFRTQRARSFVFASLGAMFAALIGLNRVRFYENGVVSLNVPPSPQVVGARASRTTHPRVLAGFGEVVGEVVGRRFQFENPFLWKTKTDVVEVLRGARCADLVGDSTSCGHTWELTREHTHCGMCSQCIDRRLAVLAARVEDHDPEVAYVTNPVVGSPPDVYAKTLIVAYMELGERVERMTAAEFLAHFGEASRVLRHCPGPASAAALRVYELYRRHADQVRGAVNRATAERVDEVTKRTLPRDGLLRLVYEGGPEGGEAAPPATSPPPAGNYFIRRGDYWAVRFGAGEEKYYRAERGFDYLRALIERPRRVVRAAELLALVQPPPTTGPHGATSADAAESGTGTGGGDPALDDAALAALLTRLNAIEEARQVIAESDSPTAPGRTRRIGHRGARHPRQTGARPWAGWEGAETRRQAEPAPQPRRHRPPAGDPADREVRQAPGRAPPAPGPHHRAQPQLPPRLHRDVGLRGVSHFPKKQLLREM